MAGQIRKGRVKQVPLATAKDDLLRHLRDAERADIVIARHGKLAGLLIGFQCEAEWFEY